MPRWAEQTPMQLGSLSTSWEGPHKHPRRDQPRHSFFVSACAWLLTIFGFFTILTSVGIFVISAFDPKAFLNDPGPKGISVFGALLIGCLGYLLYKTGRGLQARMEWARAACVWLLKAHIGLGLLAIWQTLGFLFYMAHEPGFASFTYTIIGGWVLIFALDIWLLTAFGSLETKLECQN